MSLVRPDIQIGEYARFPLGQLGGDEPVYRYRWTVVAFRRDAVVVRRLHDGLERTIAPRLFEHYRLEDTPKRPAVDHKPALDALRRARLQAAKHQTDPTQPGYYVSARKGPQYVLLLGPFVDHYSALQLVRDAWPIVRRYSDPWAEVGVGTCRTETSERQGRFNTEVFGA